MRVAGSSFNNIKNIKYKDDKNNYNKKRNI